jgi:hypothetical protein
MRTLLATLFLIAVSPVYGSIIYFTGEVSVVSPPTSLYPALENNDTILGFAEQQGVLLTSPLDVGISSSGTWICCSGLPSGTIDAGTTVNSYLLYASPSSDETGESFREFTGSITFSPGERIVGIIVSYTGLANTDTLLGAPGTTYPPGTDRTAGIQMHDEVIVGANMESVYVKFYIEAGNSNMIRILTTTATPEPAAFAMLGSGLMALALFGRRRFGRATSR